MTRREALAVFGIGLVATTIPDIGDPWKEDQKLTRQELKSLIRGLDRNYPYATSLLSDLPEHIHTLNRIVLALVEEIL